jgi:hypothetical protein
MNQANRNLRYPKEFDSELYQFLGKTYTPIYKLTPFIQDWILKHFPETTHIRLKKFCGLNQRHQVWIGCWKNPIDETSKPIWSHIFHTQSQC